MARPGAPEGGALSGSAQEKAGPGDSFGERAPVAEAIPPNKAK